MKRRILSSVVVVLATLWLLHAATQAQGTMQLVTADKGWATANGRLFWTNDNGAQWKDISPRGAGTKSDVFFLDESHGWVLLGDYDEGTDLVSFRVAAKADSGQTWSISLMKAPSQKPDELDGRAWLDFVDAQHGLVVHPKTSSAFSAW